MATASFLFERPHHRRIVTLLQGMSSALLRETCCYFAGGTAIALQLGEYRESVDIDFLCADGEGYRRLRTSVFDHGLAELFPAGVETLREVRADRDGIRSVLVSQGVPVKFEIVREARVTLDAIDVPGLPVPCLTRSDLFTEKLLANADRYGDKSVLSRDLIDLIVMQLHWGSIPAAARIKAISAYGPSVDSALDRATRQLREQPAYLAECLTKMAIDESTGQRIRHFLNH